MATKRSKPSTALAHLHERLDRVTGDGTCVALIPHSLAWPCGVRARVRAAVRWPTKSNVCGQSGTAPARNTGVRTRTRSRSGPRSSMGTGSSTCDRPLLGLVKAPDACESKAEYHRGRRAFRYRAPTRTGWKRQPSMRRTLVKPACSMSIATRSVLIAKYVVGGVRAMTSFASSFVTSSKATS